MKELDRLYIVLVTTDSEAEWQQHRGTVPGSGCYKLIVSMARMLSQVRMADGNSYRFPSYK